MTHTDFVRHFKTAVTALGVWEYDEPGADATALDAAAARVWRLWLIPGLFDGFEPVEWRLDVAEQVTAREQVNRFRVVAEHLATNGDPTAADVAPARVAFRHIYRAVRPFLFDQYRLALLRDVRRIVLDPSDAGVRRWVISADLLIGENWSGEPALDVWAVVADESPDDDSFWAGWEPLRMRLQTKLWERVEADRHVYLSLRTVSEVVERISGVPA